MTAFEEVIAATSTDQAPWYIVPANRKWYRNLVVAELVVQALTTMKLSTPPAPSEFQDAEDRLAGCSGASFAGSGWCRPPRSATLQLVLQALV
jgi:hypothetical protein